jgi:hypothetical protein
MEVNMYWTRNLPVALGLLLEGEVCEITVLGCAGSEDAEHVYAS